MSWWPWDPWPGVVFSWPMRPGLPPPPAPDWPPTWPPGMLFPWLRRGAVTVSTSDPGGAAPGSLWLNPANNVLSAWDGTKWIGYLPLTGGRIDGDLTVTGRVDFGP